MFLTILKGRNLRRWVRIKVLHSKSKQTEGQDSASRKTRNHGRLEDENFDELELGTRNEIKFVNAHSKFRLCNLKKINGKQTNSINKLFWSFYLMDFKN